MSTPPVPRELHIYYDEDGQTADLVVVFALRTGNRPTKLRGDAQLAYDHQHHDAGPDTDTIHLDLTFQNANAPGRHSAEVSA